MGKSVVNPLYEQSANSAYAKGGFRPRRKHERRFPYDQFPTFADQQGQVTQHLELIPNPIVKVEFLGTFLGYGHHGNEVTYRAFKVTLVTGKVVAGYSNDRDDFVMCLHTEYVQ